MGNYEDIRQNILDDNFKKRKTSARTKQEKWSRPETHDQKLNFLTSHNR